MIQQRQFRKEQEDSHYAAVILRYEREYAKQLMDPARFLCIDDKYRAKVGEPGFPVADTPFEVANLDFTNFSLISSSVLEVDIPEVSW